MEGTSSGPKATEDTETSLWLWTLLAGFGVSLKSVHQELSLKCVFRFLGVGGFYLNFQILCFYFDDNLKKVSFIRHKDETFLLL